MHGDMHHCDVYEQTQGRTVCQGRSVGRAPDLQAGGHEFNLRPG